MKLLAKVVRRVCWKTSHEVTHPNANQVFLIFEFSRDHGLLKEYAILLTWVISIKSFKLSSKMQSQFYIVLKSHFLWWVLIRSCPIRVELGTTLCIPSCTQKPLLTSKKNHHKSGILDQLFEGSPSHYLGRLVVLFHDFIANAT